MTEIIPVIHCLDKEQVIYNCNLVDAADLRRVFLINHAGPYRELYEFASYASKIVPWVGINCLDLDAKTAIKLAPDWVNAIWTDNPGIDEDAKDPLEAVKEIREIQFRKNRSRTNELKHFGSVAFKYQPPVKDLKKVITEIVPHCLDVVVTSGSKTGSPPAVDKIVEMDLHLSAARDVLRYQPVRISPFDVGDDLGSPITNAGKVPLAIASGITPENARDYSRADYFMVATGISRNFHELDLDRILALKENMV